LVGLTRRGFGLLNQPAVIGQENISRVEHSVRLAMRALKNAMTRGKHISATATGFRYAVITALSQWKRYTGSRQWGRDRGFWDISDRRDRRHAAERSFWTASNQRWHRTRWIRCDH
jgi:hypothetical protein